MRADVVIGSSDHRSTIWHQPKIYRCVTPLCDKISEKSVTRTVFLSLMYGDVYFIIICTPISYYILTKKSPMTFIDSNLYKAKISFY